MAADFPTNIWLRDPVIDGRIIPGGGLNRAMALLSQCRDEITAIETKLGTTVRGTAASLVARLAVHHSPSGLRRGHVYCLRGPNAVGAAKSSIENWWIGSTNFIQVGVTNLSGSLGTITFPTAYSVAPKYVVAKYRTISTTGIMGSVQVLYDTITTTQFQTQTRQNNSSGVWGNVTENYQVNWAAFGGAP